MPIYAIKGLNGTTYRINGPPGATQAQIQKQVLHFAPEAAQKPSIIEKIPGVGGILSSSADLPLRAAQSVVGVAKAGAQAFGANNAVAKAMGSTSDVLEGLTSAQSRGDEAANAADRKAAEGKGLWEQTKAVGRGLARNPLDTAAELVGGVAPFVAAEVATGGVGTVPLIVGGTMGATTGAGMVKGAIYDAVKAEMLHRKGISKEQAEAAATAAQSYGGPNTLQIGLGAFIGTVATSVGAPRLVARNIAMRSARRVIADDTATLAEKEAAQATIQRGGGKAAQTKTVTHPDGSTTTVPVPPKGLPRRMAKSAVLGGAPAAAQMGQTRLAQNLALQNVGADVPTWQGVGGEAVSGGVTGALLGAAFGTMHGEHAPGQPGADTASKPPPFGRSPEETADYELFLKNTGDDRLSKEMAAHYEDQRIETRKLEAEALAKKAAQQQQQQTQQTTPGATGATSKGMTPVPPSAEALLPTYRQMWTAEFNNQRLPGTVEDYVAAKEEEWRKSFAPVKFGPGAGPDHTAGLDDTISDLEQQWGGQKPAGSPTGEPAGAQPSVDTEIARVSGILNDEEALTRYAGHAMRGDIEGAREQLSDQLEGLQAAKNVAATAPIKLPTVEELTPPLQPGTEPPPVTPVESPIDKLKRQHAEAVASGDTEAAQALKDKADKLAERVGTAAKEARQTTDTGTPETTEKPAATTAAEAEAVPDIRSPEYDLYSAKRLVTELEKMRSNVDDPGAHAIIDARIAQAKEALAKLTKPDREGLALFGEATGNEDAASLARDALAKEQEAPAPEPEPETPPVPQETPDMAWGLEPEVPPEALPEAPSEPAPEKPAKPAKEPVVDERQPELPEQPERTKAQIAGTKGWITRQRNKINDALMGRLRKIEQRLHAAYPEVNKAYRVTYEPDKKLSFRVVSDQGVHVAARSEAELRRKVSTLEPYDPSPSSAGHDLDAGAPTVAAQMSQDLATDIRLAAEQGQIKDSERAAINRLFEREGVGEKAADNLPKDRIERAEYHVREAQAELKNAKTDAEKAAATEKFAALSDGLRNMITAHLAPIHAKLAEAIARNKGTKNVSNARPSMGEPGARGAPLAHVKAAVNRIIRSWTNGIKFEVHRNYDSLPLDIVAQITPDYRNAKGFITADGRGVILSDNLHSVDQVPSVVYHEALGHAGLTKKFGAALDSVLRSLYDGNEGIKAETDAWLADPRNAETYADLGPKRRLIRAVDEVLAARSEAGPIERSIMQKLVGLVRSFAREMGMKLAFSDNDVLHILAQAHENIMRGKPDEFAPKSAETRYSNESSPKVKEYQKRGADLASEGAAKIDMSRSAEEAQEGVKLMVPSHNGEPIIEAAKANWAAYDAPTVRKILPGMLTSGIIDWMGERIPRIKSAWREVRAMGDMKRNMQKSADPLIRRMNRFQQKHGVEGNKALANAEHASLLNETDATEGKSVADALKINRALTGIEGILAKNSNNPAMVARALDAIRAEVEAGRANPEPQPGAAVPRVKKAMDAIFKAAVNREDADVALNQFLQHAVRVRDAKAAYEHLGKFAGGQQIYKDTLKYHADNLKMMLALLDRKIAHLSDEATAKKLMKMRIKLMERATDPDESHKARDIYWNLPSEWFPKQYVPLTREGKYWLRVAEKTEKGKIIRPRAFYSSHSVAARDALHRDLARKYGVDITNDSDQVFKKGNDISELSASYRDEDSVIGKVMDELDTLRNKATVGKANVDATIDAINQVWLMSSPERSIRRRFLHSNEVAGFSSNTDEALRQRSISDAAQLSKLAYAHRIDLELQAAHQSIEGMPDALKLTEVIKAMELRADQQMNPMEANNALNIVNRLSHAFFLTSVRTAVSNLYSIPARTIPRLWKDFGYVDGSKNLLKYAKLWDALSFPHWGKGEGGLAPIMPSLGGTSKIKNDPILRRAFEEGQRRNVSQTVQGTLIEQERSSTRSPSTSKAASLFRNVSNVMAHLFTATESISREMSYMMMFEAKYAHEKKTNPGGDPEEHFQNAVQYASENTEDVLGGFSDFERPTLFKNDLTRPLTTFKMFTMAQSKFLFSAAKSMITNWHAIIPGADHAQARKELGATMRELSGLLLFVGAFAGLRGMPLYTPMSYVVTQGVKQSMSEDEQMLAAMSDGVDVPTMWDSNTFFRRFMKGKFGAPSVPGLDGKLHSWGDIMVNGLVSELSNIDFGSSTSYDLHNMWIRDTVEGDSSWDTIMNFAAGNIAAASFAKSMFDGFNAFQDGDIDKGLQKTLPGFVRGAVGVEQLQRKGYRANSKNNIIQRADNFSTPEKVAMALGWRTQNDVDFQNLSFAHGAANKKIMEERTKLSQRYVTMRAEGRPTHELAQFIAKDVEKFNRTYPTRDYVLTIPSLQNSWNSYLKSNALQVKGMPISKKTGASTLKAITPFTQ